MMRETGKDRWNRIPKDYFKKSDKIHRTKFLLSVGALVLALGWWASGQDWTGSWIRTTDLNSLRTNHGPVAEVHRSWENKCEVCHVPFEPIDGRPLLSSVSTPASRSSDQLCIACHAGPSHHENAIETDVKGCAECHRDHRGREASLVRLNDMECTRCHADLKSHMKEAGPRKFENAINAFALGEGNHPSFRPEAASYADPKKPVELSKLKFNHALHMSPGLTKNLGDSPYTIDKIPVKAEQARYQADPKTKAVILECASCHVLDATDLKPGSRTAPAGYPATDRAGGKYYLPVTFEGSCRACHIQTYAPITTGPDALPIEATHGIPPAEVSQAVRANYAALVVAEDPQILDTYIPKARLRGKTPTDTKVKDRVDSLVKAAEEVLFKSESGCVECHYTADGKPDGDWSQGVAATRVPQVWFTHAQFDHTAHRGVSCRDCHAEAFAIDDSGKPVPNASVVHTDVLNPNIDNCVKCHAPQSGGGFFSRPSSMTGGVRFDCNECHTYHNGKHPLAGPGALAEDAGQHRSIDDFIAGALKESPKASH
jgi:hypothetical protein